ncbi:MAG: hypothetical protein ACE5LH_08645 [Fidelibacterota bacterium]
MTDKYGDITPFGGPAPQCEDIDGDGDSPHGRMEPDDSFHHGRIVRGGCQIGTAAGSI